MHAPQTTALLLSLLAAPLPSLAKSLRCENMMVSDHRFDLSKLGGAHSVMTSKYIPSSDIHENTTYTLDICRPMDKKKAPKCPNGTRVCAVTHELKKGEDEENDDTFLKSVAIAGNLEDRGGSPFDFEMTRLKTSESHSDSKKEGIRVVLKGGKDPLTGPVKERRAQKAVIEFLCDPDKTGKEGEWGVDDEKRRRDDGDDKGDEEGDGEGDGGDDKGDDKGDDDGEGEDEGESSKEHQLKKDDAALIWESFGPEDDADILRLTWYTKYACENRDDSDDPDEDGGASAHWGFFTWFVIIVFLGIASYLIFGSWLNYNRYGARGWDLVPHGDTIRDVPYLMKDWVRRVLNTVQGAGSRGGYSAV